MLVTIFAHRNVRHGNSKGEGSQDFRCQILDDIPRCGLLWCMLTASLHLTSQLKRNLSGNFKNTELKMPAMISRQACVERGVHLALDS